MNKFYKNYNMPSKYNVRVILDFQNENLIQIAYAAWPDCLISEEEDKLLVVLVNSEKDINIIGKNSQLISIKGKKCKMIQWFEFEVGDKMSELLLYQKIVKTQLFTDIIAGKITLNNRISPGDRFIRGNIDSKNLLPIKFSMEIRKNGEFDKFEFYPQSFKSLAKHALEDFKYKIHWGIGTLMIDRLDKNKPLSVENYYVNYDTKFTPIINMKEFK
jgi:hypothetical protein